MQIKILGCSGGIGGTLRTTSMLIDHDILVDAGTGVSDLNMEELLAIDHIFVTHAHLDHIALLPLLLDTVMGIRVEPVTVHANRETLNTLRDHIFNWKVWPDFNRIPSAEKPFLQYNEVNVGETVNLSGRKFIPLPVNHVVPAVGYHIDSGKHSLVFTGDTTECNALWSAVNNIQNLKYLIIETAFSNCEYELAKLSKHLCPSMLATELGKFKHHNEHRIEIYITHLKPGEGESILQEIGESDLAYSIQALDQQKVFNL
jgi:ribonuclease BN (tRNA processing enzyme)